MTRIEVFVDAAFAFAVTMLVISFDHIPETYEQIIEAIKGIPAFAVSVAQLVWIWHEHVKWSWLYGMENTVAVALSAALLIVVMIYIYPLRVMIEGMFYWLSGGYLPSGFSMRSYGELANMFVFMGIGFFALGLIFVLMYRYSGKLKSSLRLSEYEAWKTRSIEILWTGIACTGLVAVVLALTLPETMVPYSGFAFALIGIWASWVGRKRSRDMKAAGIQPHPA